MATKKKKDRSPKAGKQPLAAGEATVRSMIYLPASIAVSMEKRALKKAKGNVSKYLRDLVKKDLGMAV